jgi:hypothetical protein
MEDIEIKESPTTPEVNLKFSVGKFEIKGVSIPEDTEEFYAPILEAIQTYIRDERPEKIQMVFKLIYVNTSTSAILGRIIKIFENTNDPNLQVNIQWYYEQEDEDMKDLGEDFSSFSEIKFEMIPCEEII